MLHEERKLCGVERYGVGNLGRVGCGRMPAAVEIYSSNGSIYKVAETSSPKGLTVYQYAVSFRKERDDIFPDYSWDRKAMDEDDLVHELAIT